MSQTFEDVIEAVFALPVADRVRLADQLLTSLNGSDGGELDPSWAEEAERRIAEYEAGRIKAVDAEEVLRPRRSADEP